MTKKVFFQKTVLMLAFLFVGWSAMATNYIVRGAGTSACNGTYTETGVYNGKPYYLYNSGGTMYGISWLGTKWGISKTTNGAVADTRNTYYTNTSTSSTPPETGWVKTFGTTPIPTVIRESGNLHYSSAMFFENINNDGGIQSKVFITHDNFGGQTFDGTISEDFVASGKAIVNNVPAGLTAQIILKDDLTVELSFTGNVLSHTVSNNISNLEVIFNDDAFTGSDPANVNKSTKSDFAIYFSNNILQVPSEYSTIAAAIAAASPYDIIQIAAGTYTEPGLAVNKELTFVGEDPSTTIVQAHADYNVATDRVFNILNVPAVKVSRFFNLTIQNGKVNASGAGIRIFSSLEMFNCIITNNISIGNSGAGISCNNLLLDGCLISNNLVNGGGQIRGVGVAAQSAFITNCTFSGNTHISTGADWNKGAAIYLSGEYSTSTIVNSTITNNSCSGTSSDTRGGGICIDIRTELNLKNCIIYGNTAIKGADLYRDNEFYVNKINAYNSIIGVMAAYSGDAINGYNVNVSSADPLLVALADNGGPSQTCALQIGSPAIDAGLHGITETDQRGYYANGIRDIGAFEYEGIDPSSQPLQLVFTTTAANQVVKIPLKGTVDVTVDWGDGNSDTWTTATNAAHSYLSAGTYTVSISGTLTGLGRSSSYLNEFKNYLTKVISWGDVGLEDLSNAFNYCTLLTEVPNNLPVTVTNLSKTFISATGFNGDISNWNTSSVTTMEAMFADADLFNQDIGNWDVSNVENMSWMFSGADNFNQDISNWNVSNVTNMSGMFDYAPVFNQDISSWNTASVTDMSWMFDAGTPGANAFDQNISNWDISSVTTMEGMFANVTLSTTNYDAILIGWASQTVQPNVTFDGGNSKYSCSSSAETARTSLINDDNWTITDGGKSSCPMQLVITTTGVNQYIDLPLYGTVNCTVNWGDGNSENFTTEGYKLHTFASAGTYTVSISGTLTQFGNSSSPWNGINYLTEVVSFGETGLTSLTHAFVNAPSLTSVPADLPNTITDLSYCFSSADVVSITNLENWDVTNVTNMSKMFYGAEAFNQDISSWNVSNVTNMSGMFYYARAFNQNISSWNVGNVTNMYQMFYRTENFNQPIGNWNVASVTNMSQMFYWAYVFNQDINSWDVSNVTNMSDMFDGAYAFNGNISSWNVGNVTNMAYMFSSASAFNQNIGSWNVGNVIDMQGMFSGSAFNQDISNWNVIAVTNMSEMFQEATAFNQDISGWNVSNVTDMSSMFREATAFNQNISSWNVGNVTNMGRMFREATAFNQDISGWDVADVTDMGRMFYGDELFNQNISSWNVANVIYMGGMFSGAIAFNQDISSWNVSNVTDMADMFANATSFDQNLGAWNVTSVYGMDYMFENVTLSTANYDAILLGWASQTLQPNLNFHGGNSKYSCVAVDARQSLIDNHTWTITDGGLAPDNTAPVITSTHNAQAIDANANCEASLADYTGDVTATDNCSDFADMTVTQTPAAGTTISGATNAVTLKVEDENGNFTEVTFNVAVVDNTNPETPTLTTLTDECSVTATAPTTTDACAGTITGTTSDPLTYTEQGTFIITWNFDDGNGNSIDVEQTVIVDDVTNPETPTLTTLTGECSVTATAPTTTDACAGTITGTTSDPLVYTEQGTYTITWTFDDGNGNSIDVEQTVIVDDVTNPETPTSNTLTGECSVTVTETPTAEDACAGSITGTTSDELYYDEQGTYTITWNFDDGNGNSIDVEQTVIVDDVTNPETPTLNTLTGECSVTATAPTTTDACAGEITGTTTDPLTYTAQGTYTITWTFDDGNGNSIDVDQTIIVDDQTAPEITCVNDQEVTADDTHTYTVQGTEFDPTATDDNCEVASVVNDFNNTATLDGATLPEGTTTIVWTVTDNAGNTTTCEYDVLVNDFVNVNDLSAKGISIYPNPTSGTLTIDNSELIINNLIVTDITGKMIIKKSVLNKKESIDLSNYSNGIYFINIQTSEKVFTTKVIKE